MFKQLGSFMEASLFYLIAFTLALLIALFGQGLGEASGPASMSTSLIAVLTMLLVVTPAGYSRAGWKALALHKLGWSKWGLAIVVPLAIMAGTYLIIWGTGVGYFTSAHFPTVIDLVLMMVVQCVFGLAEEIGWRGYLLPRLLPLGRMRALLLSGLLHGIWHLPLILLTSFYHPNGNRVIIVGLFLLTLTAAGVLYGYLRLTSESVWPVGIAHGVYNGAWNLFAGATVVGASPRLLDYLASESGLIPLIGLIIFSGWLVYRWQQRPVVVQTPPILVHKSLA